MRINTILFFIVLFFLSCGGRSTDKGISEFEQRKYNNTIKQLNSIYEEASDASASGSQFAIYGIKRKIESITYDFSGNKMSVENRQKCQNLKDRINHLKANPEAIFCETSATGSNNIYNGILINYHDIKINGLERFPCWLNQGDTAMIKVNSSPHVITTLYNYTRSAIMKQWEGSVNDFFIAKNSGIYVIEIKDVYKHIRSSVSIRYKGKNHKPHRIVKVRMVDCKKNDFLSMSTDGIVTENIWEQPKKIGLRGNLKAIFSGKSRSLISIPIPQKCDALLYSMRISTNENTISSDGKFSERLSTSYKNIHIFGLKVYEKQEGSDILNRLLFNTRPPREEDAFCNFYVFSNQIQAKKFQDGKDASGKLKYDVEQSQMGTQSCNGRLSPSNNRVIYMGFENERMRYDNYIWLEVVALTHTIKYVKPIYY